MWTVFSSAKRKLHQLTLFHVSSVTGDFQKWDSCERRQGGQWEGCDVSINHKQNDHFFMLVLGFFLFGCLFVCSFRVFWCFFSGGGFWVLLFWKVFLNWNHGRWDLVEGIDRGRLHSHVCNDQKILSWIFRSLSIALRAISRRVSVATAVVLRTVLEKVWQVKTKNGGRKAPFTSFYLLLSQLWFAKKILIHIYIYMGFLWLKVSIIYWNFQEVFDFKNPRCSAEWPSKGLEMKYRDRLSGSSVNRWSL